MSEKMASFAGTYSDWKLIKTRSVVQIVFEVPLEQADEVYQVLGGMPDFGSERWFAIARLVHEAAKEVSRPEPQHTQPAPARDPHVPPARAQFTGCGASINHSDPTDAIKRHRSWRDMPAAAQAGLRCNEIPFQRFLQETWPDSWKLLNLGTEAEKAAEIVRFLCDVQSRKDIRPGTESFEKWCELGSKYQAWLLVPA